MWFPSEATINDNNEEFVCVQLFFLQQSNFHIVSGDTTCPWPNLAEIWERHFIWASSPFMTGCLCLQKPSFSSHIVLQVLEFVNIVQLVSGWNQARFAFEKKTITTQFKLDMATTIISQYKNLWNKIQVKSEFGSDWKKSFDYSEIRGFAFCWSCRDPIPKRKHSQKTLLECETTLTSQ